VIEQIPVASTITGCVTPGAHPHPRSRGVGGAPTAQLVEQRLGVPGTVKNQLFAALDWVPTFVDIAGGAKGHGLKKRIEAGEYPGIVKTTLQLWLRRMQL
jgi:hypothetical protein